VLEKIDREKRKKNLILFEMPETPLTMDDLDTDAKKISRVWHKLGLTRGLYSKDGSYRLGKGPAAGGRPRPMLIQVMHANQKAKIFSLAKKLKDESKEFYSKTNIKTDETPAFQNEMKRLAGVCKMEKEKPENSGKMVIFNRKAKQVTVDGSTDDKMNLNF
jgi:hypothetical protein